MSIPAQAPPGEFAIVKINISRTAAAQSRLLSWRIELIWYDYHGRAEVVNGAPGRIEIVDLSIRDLHVAGP